MSDNMVMPLVSVGMPVYNGGKVLTLALDLILAQDYPNLEIIISDNASTDGSDEICREYARRDSRIRFYLSDINKGGIWNFNRVLNLATGKYFMWAAHDDRRASSYISKCVACMEMNPTAVLCQTHAIVHIEEMKSPLFRATLDSVANVTCPIERYAYLLKWLPPTTVYGLFRTDAAKSVRPWGNFISTDAVFTLEIALRGEIAQVPEDLFVYYGRAKRRTVREDYAVLRPDNKMPPLYSPFLVLAYQHAAGIIRSPLSTRQKARLLGILFSYELKQATAKLALRIAKVFGGKTCPAWIADIIDERAFLNPNFQYLMEYALIPYEHRRPSQLYFS